MTLKEQQDQAAQDLRDKIAEDTLLMVAQLMENAGYARSQTVRRASALVSDLRHVTGRQIDGSR